MNYLAIDTSGRYLTVIASADGKRSVRFLPDCALSHSVALMGEIENALNDVRIEAKDVDVFACSVGAGSFTGIRIGVSTVKAFAYAFHKKVLGVTTFDSLAYSIENRVKKLTLVSARHSNYYVCGYDEDGKISLPPKFMTADEIRAIKDGYTLVVRQEKSGGGRGVIYREWRLKDVGEVVELEKKCFSDPWNADMVLSSFNLPQFVGFVAEDGGKVVGYVGATAVFTDCDVLLVAVAEKYRRQGIAKGLFGKLFDALVSDGGEKVFLEVRSRNRAARACYESLGFSEIGVRNNYYGDDDAVIMEKDL